MIHKDTYITQSQHLTIPTPPHSAVVSHHYCGCPAHQELPLEAAAAGSMPLPCGSTLPTEPAGLAETGVSQPSLFGQLQETPLGDTMQPTCTRVAYQVQLLAAAGLLASVAHAPVRTASKQPKLRCSL